MSNGNGHHWSKFFWRDWYGDRALHDCSIAARGFWIEMLCIMHEGSPVGHLTTANGKQATIRQMATSANVTEREAKKLLAELEEAGVFSRTDDGTIWCRRMVRDAAASEVGREHAGKRWNTHPPNGSPNGSPNGKATGEANGEATGRPNGNPIAKSQKLEVEAEPEEEESKFKTLTYASPVLARVAAASEAPPPGTYGGEPEQKPASNAIQLATKNLVEKLGRKLESSGEVPQGKRAQRTPVEQVNAVLYGEVIEPDGPRRGPVDPVRTVEEQLAALGHPRTLEVAA